MTTDRSSGAAGEPPRPSARSSRPPRSRTTGASSSTSSAESVEAGRIGRAHGLDGSFHVTRPEPDLLDAPLWVRGELVEIDRRAGRPDRPILRIAGVSSREAIEALRGEPLHVARADLPPLEEDEIWAHDVEGCAVTDGERPVGAVRRMIALPSCDVLEVQRPEGGEPLLVPLVRDAVRSIDLEARRVDVDLGFLGAD